jgi:ribosomal peptide maturation radical SAM protein 1
MICLAEMPFAALTSPPIGGRVISALLKDAGLEVKSIYFNADLAREIGYEAYHTFSTHAGMRCWIEWLFAAAAWEWDEAREEESVMKLVNIQKRQQNCVPDPFLDHMRRVRRDVIPGFMNRSLEKIKNLPGLYAVGFSCLFNLLPALAMGRVIHDALPQVRLVYGGAALHGEMGEEIFDKTEWIDAVSTSEADDVAAEVFRRLRDGRPLEGLRGMMHRDRASGKVYKTPGSGVPAEFFDNGVVPDFDDFFADMNEYERTRVMKDPELLMLPFESSRGCWWHDKIPCTFCGLNRNYRYRLKSPENVISTLKTYKEKYGISLFNATDANLSMNYFDTFLPALKGAFPGGAQVFYCLKSSLNRGQIKALAEAGVKRTQPGIESLSDHVLKLMNKGVSAIQNVFFLKCAAQYGIYPFWFNLLGTSGETPEDCLEIAALMPKLWHLVPPGQARAFVMVHRSSEYWQNPSLYLDEMKPESLYEALFPDTFDRMKVAYAFDVKWKIPEGQNPKDLQEAQDAVVRAIAEWRMSWNLTSDVQGYQRTEGTRKSMKGPELRLTDGGGKILDTREGKRVEIVLDAKEKAVCALLDDVILKGEILGKSPCPPEETVKILDDFVKHGLAIRSGELYLGLALPGESPIEEMFLGA